MLGRPSPSHLPKAPCNAGDHHATVDGRSLVNTIGPDKIAAIKEMTERGESLRSISNALDIHKATVKRYRKYFCEGVDIGLCECGRPRNHKGFCQQAFQLRQLINPAKCGCGEPAFHRGWCWYRFAKSPARQATMARMHGKQNVRIRTIIKQTKSAQALPWDGIKPPDLLRLMAGR